MVRADRSNRRLGLLAAVLLAAVPPATGLAGEAATRNSAGETATRPVRPVGGAVEGRRVSEKPKSEGYGPWLRTLGALAVVVAMIFGARFVLRRLAGSSRAPTGPKALEVLARAPLGPRQQLVIVRLGRRLVLVGSGPAGMSALAEVSDSDEVAELLGELGPGKAEAFADALKRHQTGAAPGGAVRSLADRIRSQLSSKEEGKDR